jgi:hypothetical protein
MHGHYTFNNGKMYKKDGCSKDTPCICKSRTCNKCPINTFSEGVINPTCTPCPKDRPTTNFQIGQATCIPVPKIICEPGHEHIIGDGITRKKECTECKVNQYSPGGADVKCSTCPENRPTTNGRAGRRTGQSECKACEPGYGMTYQTNTNTKKNIRPQMPIV